MKRTILFSLLMALLLPLHAQIFQGRVTDGAGTPLPYAALYLRETRSGFVTDDEGCFHTTLPVGRYTCEVSSLGYNKAVMTIDVKPEGLRKDIVLTEHVYRLKEVQITRDGEDPAYTVMRNAIANAPRHRYKVSRYEADTYLKGSGKLIDIPALLLLSKEVREMADKYMGRTFLLEEQRKVTYKAPGDWDNEVVAYANSFPEGMTVIIETTDINLYAPRIFGHVSPLSAGAFSYYTYKLEGCVAEGDYLINKVKVIPRKDSPDLVSGYLYVVEDLWCLTAVELNVGGMGMKGMAKVSCNEVKPGVFLSTSISLESTFGAFGMKAEAAYLSSIKYREVELADQNFMASLADSASKQPVSPARLTAKQQKNLEKINQLMAKGELSNRESYKLARLMEKSALPTDSVKPKHKYERRQRSYNLKTDSLAHKRDSLYWQAVRSVPLSEEELAGYAYKKSLEKTDAPSTDSLHRTSFGKELLQVFMMGKTYETRNEKAQITLHNFRSLVPEYNFVDGLWVGATFDAALKLPQQTRLTFTPRAYYTTARHKWVGSATLALHYAPRRRGKLWLSAGSTSADFNGTTGQYRPINSYTALILGRSDIKFYDKQYFTAGNRFELANSLTLTTTLDHERRKALENVTSASLFGRKNAKPNTPAHPLYQPMPAHELLAFGVELTYTPAHYYRMSHGEKVYEQSPWPTFGLHYRQALKHGSGPAPTYKKAEFSAHHHIDFGFFSSLAWYVNAGLFWDADDMQFADFRHFTSTRLPLTAHTFDRGFALPDSYALSTPDRWLQANLTWRTPYLLLKQLPFLQRKAFDEALHLRTLLVPHRDAYTELGYSVGLMDMGRVGVFVGLDKVKYKSVGISVSLPMLRML